MCYTFVKGMAPTAESASSRRAAFLLAYPRSKEIPVLYLPFKNVYMGIGLKSCVHTYQRTPRQSHLQMVLSGILLTGDYLVRRLEEALLRLPFSKSS